MKNVWLHNVFARIATAKEVIEATPPELHAKILKSVENWALHYTIGRSTVGQRGGGCQREFPGPDQEGFPRQFRPGHAHFRRLAERRAIDRAAFWRSMARYQAVHLRQNPSTPLNRRRVRPMLIFPCRLRRRLAQRFGAATGAQRSHLALARAIRDDGGDFGSRHRSRARASYPSVEEAREGGVRLGPRRNKPQNWTRKGRARSSRRYAPSTRCRSG